MTEFALMGPNGLTSMLVGMTGGNPAMAIILALALAFFAFFSYKIYRAAMIILGAAAGGVPTYMYLVPILSEAFDMYEAWFPLVVTLVGALVGIGIIFALQKLAIFAAGGVLGYLLGGFINTPIAMASESEFLMSGIGTFVIPIVCALIVGVLAGKMFRPVFIVCTALVGGLAAGSLIGFVAELGVTISMIIGIVVGVAGMITQFKTTTKRANH